MNNVVFMENLESLEKLISYFPDKFLLKTYSRLLILSVDDFMLLKGRITWRSPPSACYMRTQS